MQNKFKFPVFKIITDVKKEKKNRNCMVSNPGPHYHKPTI
jgi:hypothetical protein